LLATDPEEGYSFRGRRLLRGNKEFVQSRDHVDEGR